MMIVDGVWLYVFAFNFTRLDIDGSRSLGSPRASARSVQEALRLFEADFDRKPYSSGAKDFLVSPVNARERLAAFLKGAKKQLLIYDGALTDNKMIEILRQPPGGRRRRAHHRQGREGKHGLEAEAFVGKRQHLRCIVRTGGPCSRQPEPAAHGARRAPRDRRDRPRREGGERDRQDLRVGLGEDAGRAQQARKNAA
jgi:hypothetical protein